MDIFLFLVSDLLFLISLLWMIIFIPIVLIYLYLNTCFVLLYGCNRNKFIVIIITGQPC